MLHIPGHVRRLVPRSLRQRVWRAWWSRRQIARARDLARTRRNRPRRHDLPAPLIVTLTSFPPRFGTLHLTIRSLLDQDLRPDAVILWIAHDDLGKVPRAVRRLTRRGLDIRGTADLRSYKKLVPALAECGPAFLATADDDVFYPPDWLDALAQTWRRGHRAYAPAPLIACHRAHRVPEPTPDATLAPYRGWEWDVQPAVDAAPARDLMPTGVGGVLYPPNCFHADVLDVAAFQTLAPTADDLWFYWMARRAGAVYAKTPGTFVMIDWPGAEETGLMRLNAGALGDANDAQAARLVARYGHPLTL